MPEKKRIEEGDRVEAINLNGDTAEFTVKSILRDGTLTSATNAYEEADGWSFKNLTPDTLPTEYGLYVSGLDELDLTELSVFRLDMSGWSRLDYGENQSKTTEDIKNIFASYGLRRLVREKS